MENMLPGFMEERLSWFTKALAQCLIEDIRTDARERAAAGGLPAAGQDGTVTGSFFSRLCEVPLPPQDTLGLPDADHLGEAASGRYLRRQDGEWKYHYELFPVTVEKQHLTMDCTEAGKQYLAGVQALAKEQRIGLKIDPVVFCQQGEHIPVLHPLPDWGVGKKLPAGTLTATVCYKYTVRL